MQRSTKIVATLGPSSTDPGTLERMFVAGVDVVRLNFSHGSAQDHIQRAELVRDLCRKTGRTVAIMADLQGPKIRIGRFKDGRITLKKGDEFVLDAECELGDQGRDVKNGDMLLLDHGRMVLDVVDVVKHRIHCTVRQGAELSNNKGINRK